MRSGGGAIGARYPSRPMGHASYPAPQIHRGQAPSAAEIGALFRDLRRILGLSLPDLARRLGTRIEVVTALERGEMRRLPPWPETVRVVTGFTGLARIDPRPVLASIREHMDGGVTVVRVTDAPHPLRSLARATAAAASRVAATTRSAASVAWGARQAMAQNWIASASADMDFEAGARHSMAMAWLGRTGILVLLVVCLTLATYIARSTGLEGAFADLRTPIVRLVNKTQDYVARQLGSTQGSDGLRWIDVDDPRSRRSDRLRTDPR